MSWIGIVAWSSWAHSRVYAYSSFWSCSWPDMEEQENAEERTNCKSPSVTRTQTRDGKFWAKSVLCNHRTQRREGNKCVSGSVLSSLSFLLPPFSAACCSVSFPLLSINRKQISLLLCVTLSFYLSLQFLAPSSLPASLSEHIQYIYKVSASHSTSLLWEAK